MPTQRPPSIDPHAAARWLSLPQATSPWLHEEVARRMEERLALIRLQPAVWANWEPLKGGMAAQALLARRYPKSTCYLAVSDPKHAAAVTQLAAKPWWSPARWKTPPARVAMPPEGAAQMVWANMALHMAADPQALIGAWHQALAVDGFLMFSCLGPDTLRELRGVYQSLGWPAPSHEFTDMHDWGDLLVASGFAEPVLDMERITLSYESPERLLQELRTLGRNLHAARYPGLRGRRWLSRLKAALKAQLADPADGGRLKLTFEVVYGHAIKPQRRLAVSAETTVSLDEMRKALRGTAGPAS